MRDEWRFARKLKGERFSVFSFFVLGSSFFLKPHFLKPQGLHAIRVNPWLKEMP
jgi:hypothetical protein